MNNNTFIPKNNPNGESLITNHHLPYLGMFFRKADKVNDEKSRILSDTMEFTDRDGCVPKGTYVGKFVIKVWTSRTNFLGVYEINCRPFKKGNDPEIKLLSKNVNYKV